MQDRIFYSICFGFIFGVLLRSFVFFDFYFVIFILLLAGALLLYVSFLKNFNALKYRWGIISVIFILTFCLGILRFHMADVLPPRIYDSADEIVFEGEIIDGPDIRENNQKLLVENDLSGILTKFLVTTDLSENYKYGDIVSISGKVQKPQNFITDSGKDFDYVNYLRKDRIFYIINFPEIEVLSHGNGNRIKAALYSIKDKFLEKISMSIRSPENLLMGGLILGEKSAFSQELRQDFVNTGTIHIVALSGYNITIVADWFMKIFSFLPRNFSIGAGILSILLFVLMTGASSTALRAGIMAVLALYARYSGRNYDAARALVLAGVVMILVNPFVLAYDVSFQLSFIATIAVIFFTPRIEAYFLWVSKKFGLREIISVTFAAYIFVLPFILYKMGNLSLVALPANFLVLPFIPNTMLLGFLTGLLGMVHYALAVPAGFVSYLFLHYELAVIKILSDVPFAAISIPNFSLWLTLLIYLYFIYKLFGKAIILFFRETF